MVIIYFVSDCGHYSVTCDTVATYEEFIITELTLTDQRLEFVAQLKSSI
jgi:hypothetical protein